MYNRYRQTTQVLYDRAFIKLDNFQGETHYIPMLLHGRKDFLTNKHHEIWKCNWQNDKVWVFPGEKTERIWFKKEELKDFFLNSIYLDDYNLVNTRNRMISKNDYVKWMMRGLGKALTLSQFSTMNNRFAVITGKEDSKKITEAWYYNDRESEFMDKVQECLRNPAHEFVMIVPCNPKITYPEIKYDGSFRIYTIGVGNAHFRRMGRNTIHTTFIFRHSKIFATEKEVESFLKKNLNKFSSSGFEIWEHRLLPNGKAQRET